MMTTRKTTLNEAKTAILMLEKRLSLTPFHTYAWLDTIRTTLNTEPVIVVFEEGRNERAANNQPVGFIPLFPKKAGITVHFSPPFSSETAYGGIACEPGKELALYALLKKEIPNFFVVHPARLEFPGLICEPKYTVMTALDKGHEKSHLAAMKKGHRYNIQKSLKDRMLDVHESYDEKALKEYYVLLQTTYGYNGFSPLPLAFYKDIIEHFRKEGRVKLLIAYRHDRPCGTICAFIHGTTLYYWTGGFLRDPEVTRLYPNDLLQYKIIAWGYERKMTAYDMLGADLEGIRNFKLGFGGELVQYTKIYSSRKLHILSKVYTRLGPGMKRVVRKR